MKELKLKRQSMDVTRVHAKALALYIESIKQFREIGIEESESHWTAQRIVRKWTEELIQVYKPNKLSEGVVALLKESNIPLDRARNCGYNSQTTKSGLGFANGIGKGSGTGLLHFEHMSPISRLIDMCLELPEITPDTVWTCIMKNCEIAWILKSERKKLDKICKSGERTDEILESLNIVIK